MTDITQKIRDSNKFWSTNCSQSGVNSPCKAQPMCCEENHWVGVVHASSFSFIDVVHQEGLIVIGCTNINIGG